MNKKVDTHLNLDSKGFSLFEVIVAVSILSIIMILVIEFSDNLINTSLTVTSEDNDKLQIETAMARIEWDFSQIYSPLYFSHAMAPDKMSEDEGEAYNQMIALYASNNRFGSLSYDSLPIPVFQNPAKNELIFYTSSNRRRFQNDKQSHYAWVRYHLKSDDSSNEDDFNEDTVKGMILTRTVLTKNIYAAETIDWEDIRHQVLMRRVKELVFEFWNPANEKWTDNLDTIQNGFQKFYALKVKIKYLDLEGNEFYSERIFRPLFPEFTPEDMYSYLNAKQNTTTSNNATNTTTTENSEESGSSGDTDETGQKDESE